jgi:predicted Zn-dependent protease
MSLYEPDELVVVRSRFYSGNYQGAIQEADQVLADSELIGTLRDAYIIRSHLALGNLKAADALLSKLSPSNPDLQPLKILLDLKAGKKDALNALDILTDSPDALGIVGKCNAAVAYLSVGNIKSALRLVHKGDSLEELALSVIGLLRIDRPDLAEKSLAKMAEQDDDDALSQVAKIWVHLSKGFTVNKGNNEGFQEVSDSVNELIEKNGKSPALLDLMACAEIRNGNYGEALKILKEVRALSSNSDLKIGEVTLYNSLVALTHADPVPKGASVRDQVIGEMAKIYPDHAYFAEHSRLDELFERTAQKYA